MPNNAIVLTAEEWLQRIEDKTEPALGTVDRKVVGQKTKNIIEAADKQFKTTFLLRLTLGISTGQTVYPLLPVPRARKVMYLHGELSPDEIKERTASAIVGLPRPLDNFIEVKDPTLNLFEPPAQGKLYALVAEHRPEDLVIDPLQGFMPGADENSGKDVGQMRAFIDKIIDNLGVTVWLAVHTGKDGSKGTRGHSSWAGWRDAMFRLKRAESDGSLVEIKSDLRWARPIDSFWLEFVPDTNGNGGTLHPTKRKPEASGEDKSGNLIECLVIHNGKCSRGQLAAWAGLEGRALQAALKKAERAGQIEIRNGGKLICLPGSFSPES